LKVKFDYKLRLAQFDCFTEVGVRGEKLLIFSGMDRWDSNLSITSLQLDYEADIRPSSVVENIYERIEAYSQIQPSVFIHLEPLEIVLAAAQALTARFTDPSSRPPLWGVPFSVKDSIDIAGLPTTAGCPALSNIPSVSAPVYQHCIDAGALFIGKTNLEQLATGMTGCRSPYGTLHSIWSPKHAVGGSSSGSAVSVAAVLARFVFRLCSMALWDSSRRREL